MSKNTERFSDRVDNYVKYRPGYSYAIVQALKDKIGFDSDWVVADIGSGTGLSARIFLKNDNKVYTVEPNKEMREAGHSFLDEFDGFISVDGSAEATTLSDSSVDLIVAGQAFHWFDRNAFKTECKRIGRVGAYCLLMWNERKVESDFEKAYEDLLIKYATDYLKVDHRNIKLEDLEDFFSPHTVLASQMITEQSFPYEGVKGRLLSSSYAPNVGEPNYEPMIAYLREIFDQHQTDGRVSFSYDCKLFLGQIL